MFFVVHENTYLEASGVGGSAFIYSMTVQVFEVSVLCNTIFFKLYECACARRNKLLCEYLATKKNPKIKKNTMTMLTIAYIIFDQMKIRHILHL